MNVTYEKKNAMTLIGFHAEIKPNEGYQKCPEFWDKEYNIRYAQLWQTMQPQTPVLICSAVDKATPKHIPRAMPSEPRSSFFSSFFFI